MIGLNDLDTTFKKNITYDIQTPMNMFYLPWRSLHNCVAQAADSVYAG